MSMITATVTTSMDTGTGSGAAIKGSAGESKMIAIDNEKSVGVRATVAVITTIATPKLTVPDGIKKDEDCPGRITEKDAYATEVQSPGNEAQSQWLQDLTILSLIGEGSFSKKFKKAAFEVVTVTGENTKTKSVLKICTHRNSFPLQDQSLPHPHSDSLEVELDRIVNLEPHRNLVKFNHFLTKKISFEELKALFQPEILPLKTCCCCMDFIEILCGRAALYKTVDLFITHNEIAGQSLRKWMISSRSIVNSLENSESNKYKVSFKDAIKIRIAEEIICGLNFLHAQDIFHQDLKPENIHFSAGSNTFQFPIKLADFGLPASFHTRSIYDAPEVKIQPPQFTALSDYFSLGLILWEIFQEIPFSKREEYFVDLSEHSSFERLQHNPTVYNLDLLIKSLTNKEKRFRPQLVGTTFQLVIVQPNITFPVTTALERTAGERGKRYLRGREKEVDAVLNALNEESPQQIIEIRGRDSAGKTSFIQCIVSKLNKLNHKVVVMEDFELENVFNKLFQTIASQKLLNLCYFLSERQTKRWTLVLDVNLSRQNPQQISQFSELLRKFKELKNNFKISLPHVIFSSVNQLQTEMLGCKPLHIVELQDWLIDDVLENVSKLARYVTLKGGAKIDKVIVNRFTTAFTKLGRIMSKSTTRDQKLQVLKSALNIFVVIGLSRGKVSFSLLNLLLLIDYEESQHNFVNKILKSFRKANFLFNRKKKHSHNSAAEESSSGLKFRCSSVVARAIQKRYLQNREFKKLLEKVLGFNGVLGMNRWVLGRVRGKTSPLARHCFQAVSLRRRKSFSSRSRSRKPDRNANNKVAIRTNERRVKMSKCCANSLNSQQQQQLVGDQHPLDRIKLLAQETSNCSKQLGPTHSKTIEKTINLALAFKRTSEGILEAVHPDLIKKYGRDHAMTQQVRNMLPPPVVTLD